MSCLATSVSVRVLGVALALGVGVGVGVGVCVAGYGLEPESSPPEEHATKRARMVEQVAVSRKAEWGMIRPTLT
jgi:hypothetical protein